MSVVVGRFPRSVTQCCSSAIVAVRDVIAYVTDASRRRREDSRDRSHRRELRSSSSMAG